MQTEETIDVAHAAASDQSENLELRKGRGDGFKTGNEQRRVSGLRFGGEGRAGNQPARTKAVGAIRCQRLLAASTAGGEEEISRQAFLKRRRDGVTGKVRSEGSELI